MKIQVFWNMKPCWLVNSFERAWYFLLQGYSNEVLDWNHYVFRITVVQEGPLSLDYCLLKAQAVNFADASGTISRHGAISPTTWLFKLVKLKAIVWRKALCYFHVSIPCWDCRVAVCKNFVLVPWQKGVTIIACLPFIITVQIVSLHLPKK